MKGSTGVVTHLDLSKIRPKQTKTSEEAREEMLERLRQYHQADEKLKRICTELGMQVPIMTCEVRCAN